MKFFEFGVQSGVFCMYSDAVAPAFAADRNVAAVRRTTEPMAVAAAKAADAVLAGDQAFVARAPRIRFAPAASVIGSGHRIRLR